MISVILCFIETHLHYNVSNDDLFIKGYPYLPFKKRHIAPFFGITHIGEGLTAIHPFDLEAHLDESPWIEIKQKGELVFYFVTYGVV